MSRLIECVPNFSEGRDLVKVDALVSALSSVPGAWVLDRTSDADHNRSVVTLAGEPESVAEAAIRGVGKAAELIDMSRQSGAHPRIGATDVLPFIPIEGVSMQDCVALARRVGQEIWDRYRIPIYFYEGAATRPGRANLENVRKGQFEGLLRDALRDPDRSPDIGEPRLHPTAGATAVGARNLLIAYNIHLNTSDVSIAKKIAKTIRFSSGGLRHVKAIGIELKSRGIAQVSINLTNFEQTPMHRVFEMVKREAERYGCSVTGSEIIGLIPMRAVELTAEYYLQFENFSPDRVLETRLATISGAMSTGSSVQGRRETPIQAALAALYQAVDTCAEKIASKAPTKAPEGPHDDQDVHSSPGQERARSAEANLELALVAEQIYAQWVQLEASARPSMLPDIRIGGGMALAAARSALENVETDLAALRNLGHDSGFVTDMKSRMAALEARLSKLQVTAGG